MTVVDPAFVGAGQKPGKEIWRIEKFCPVKYPVAEYGKFYEGDSYIILITKQQSTSAVLSWDIHFWLGAKTSQDEKGTAAIKAVELDEMLGGVPVQHRETQEHESPLFLSYFPAGIRYLEGGVETGFKHYDPNSAPSRLFQVKGKRNVRVAEVEVNVRSMNKGDCFILDTPKKIYVYVGKFSKRTERLKAIQAANQIRDQDHGGRIKIHVIEPTSSAEDVAEYFKALGGGSRADMADPPADDDDSAFEKQVETVVTLYRVSDDSGTVKVDKVATRPLKREMLQSQDAFILDFGKSGIYVWIGKKCSKEEKIHSMKTAENFLKQNGYPAWTMIQRVVDSGEPTPFKQYFAVWKEDTTSGKALDKIAGTDSFVAPKIQEVHHDREKLRKLMKNMGKAVGFCPDNGTGKTELWRIEKFELAPVPPEKHGLFFGGDSYVLKYTYKEKMGREKYIIYFWQGTDSTQDEKAASALHAIRLDDQLHGAAVQVRVIQGYEPAHFLRIFKGRMVIFMGGHASGFRNVREHDTYNKNATKLFQIQ
jgi:gelsolin